MTYAHHSFLVELSSREVYQRVNRRLPKGSWVLKKGDKQQRPLACIYIDGGNASALNALPGMLRGATVKHLVAAKPGTWGQFHADAMKDRHYYKS